MGTTANCCHQSPHNKENNVLVVHAENVSSCFSCKSFTSQELVLDANGAVEHQAKSRPTKGDNVKRIGTGKVYTILKDDHSALPYQVSAEEGLWLREAEVELVGGTLVEQASAAPRKNLSGNWLCSDTEGDMDAMMSALDMIWLMRNAAYVLSYGVGYVGILIEDAEEVSIKVVGTPNDITQTVRVGAGVQKTQGTNGDVWVTATWEPGGVLCVHQTGPEVEGAYPCWSRYSIPRENVLKWTLTAKNPWTGLDIKETTGSWLFERVKS